jgi:hypothetical protein
MKPSTLTTAILLFTTPLLNSCEFDDYKGYQHTYYPNPAAVFAKFDKPTSQSVLNPAHGQPGHRCDLPVGSPLPSPSEKNDLLSKNFTPVPQNLSSSTPGLVNTTPSTSTGLNPAHGQPGHRCDIPVGAPLNSAPAGKQASGLPAQGSSSSSKLNPPHGQPGHRCDIPVGVPLNSAPVKPNINNLPTTTPAVTTAPGLNPLHGQPGHRCDIAVGAPLNSPVKVSTDTTKTTPSVTVPLKADSS